jgi:hypothetical protein
MAVVSSRDATLFAQVDEVSKLRTRLFEFDAAP